jgi:C terminal of Calcineurin-like phosphoesterase
MDECTGFTRRQTLIGAAALGVAVVASRDGASAAEPGAATASGVVFEDSDGSGRRGPSSRGLARVLVSNGREVAQTGNDGRWSLPVTEGASLFVIKPANYATAVDPATGLARFSHVHAPTGTPDSARYRFAGVSPSGALPESIDFPLRPMQEPTSFNAILFTDPQPESLAEVGYIRDAVVARSAEAAAAFGITHGDLMFDDLSFYDRYNRIVGSMGLPWYSCCGNHDMNLEAPDNTHSRETFKRVFGARHYAFQYGGATVFVLDNVEYLGTDPTKPNSFGKYRGMFGQQQIDFIRNVLAYVPKDSLVIYSFHIPLRTLAGGEPDISNVDTRAFLEAISSHPNSVSFSGHTHTNEHYYLGAEEGFSSGMHHHHVLSAVSGSWWSGPFDERGIPIALASDGSPNGFHLLSVNGTKYTTTLVPARDGGNEQMRIMLDSQLHRDAREVMRDYPTGALLRGPIAQAAAGSTRVVVNLFDGGPKSRVEMSVGNGRLKIMDKVERKDPFVEEVYARNPETKKPWVNAGKSSHIWQLNLPADLPVGTHLLKVRAADEFGRPHSDSMVLEVTA